LLDRCEERVEVGVEDRRFTHDLMVAIAGDGPKRRLDALDYASPMNLSEHRWI
jgi:hypothetical protein